MLSPLEVESIRSIYESDVVRILQELIRARSDFPPGDTRTAIGVVERELENAGISSQCFAMDPVRQRLV